MKIINIKFNDHKELIALNSVHIVQGDNNAVAFNVTTASSWQELTPYLIIGYQDEQGENRISEVPVPEDGFLLHDGYTYYSKRITVGVCLRKGEQTLAVSGNHIVYDVAPNPGLDTTIEPQEVENIVTLGWEAVNAMNTALSNLDSAVESANAAASTANISATNADIATDNANTAAANANETADRMLVIAQNIQEDVASGILQGPQGEKGERGEQGIQGIRGDPGVFDPEQIECIDALEESRSFLTRIIMEDLTIPVSSTGAVAQIHDIIGGLPLDIIARTITAQEGAGTASPDNIRKIVGRNKVQIKLSSDAIYEPFEGEIFDVDLPETIWGLSACPDILELKNGILTKQTAVKVFNGTESWSSYYYNKNYFLHVPGNLKRLTKNILCSHYNAVISIGDGNQLWFDDARFTTIADWKLYLAAQYEAGTPVTVVYQLTEPKNVALNSPAILSFPGSNTVCADAGGNTTVTGLQGLQGAVKTLTNAIIKLGGTV